MGWYYVKVDGQRWSPLCSREKAVKSFMHAVNVFQNEKGLHVIQIVHIESEAFVGKSS